MRIFFFLISFVYLAVFTKKMLFWFWLWQLKQYYAKRVLDHFQTAKGKKLIFNPWNLAKFVLILGAFFLPFSPFVCLFMLFYSFEAVVFVRRISDRSFRYPVLTKKTLSILASGFLLEVLILFWFWQSSFDSAKFFALVLGIDLVSPLIFSFLVLSFSPVSSFLQKRVIKAAKRKREKMTELLAIGITGSYGKTSTKEILAEILSRKFKTFKTLKHQNTDPAVAQYMLNKLDSSYQIFVAEMGAYFRGGIKSACDFVQPKIGIIAGINQQHLALFGSMENLISAEGGEELIESLPQDGLIIFNGENRYCWELYQETKKPKKIYGLSNNLEGIASDVWAEDIKIEKELSSFKVVCKDGDACDFKIKLLGRHSILNILGAVCAAKHLGLSLQEIADTCAGLGQDLGGMVLKQGIDELNIIDSSYSSNPDGFISAFDY
jgi:UDP-N-acetylmuramoyl-tripeptide--D-alanyl-D-alanine ligase